jgi:hypothetical protein
MSRDHAPLPLAHLRAIERGSGAVLVYAGKQWR